MSDFNDEHSVSSSGSVIQSRLTGDHDNAITITDSQLINPALAYLLSLNSPRSRQTMSSFLNIVARMLKAENLYDCRWSALRRHHVQAVLEMLRDADKAPATINTYLSALKGVATEAWAQKQLDVDAWQQIRLIRSVRGSRLQRGRALAREEIRALFAVCDADREAKGLRDAAIFGVLLGCGLRRSEVVALSMQDLIPREQAVRVLGKGNKERLAFIPAGTWLRVQRWIEQVRGEHAGPLFTRIRRFDDVTDNRLTDQAIYYILDIRRLEAGLDKCAPHDMRRTFATAMLENGEDLITVKDAMGHASVNTTQRYDRRGEQRLRRARDRLDIE